MELLYIVFVLYILTSISLYFLFPKAGIEGWKGLVPGLNFIEWSSLVGRPKWWAILILIPLVNIFIFTGLAVNLVRSFGRFKLWESAMAVFITPVIFFMMSKDDNDKYEGPILDREKAYLTEINDAMKSGHKRKLKKLKDQNPYKKAVAREWIESLFFAVFAAAFIRMFLIEPYLIPTPSMEGSLNVGDFLFVSKAHYGIRTPSTIAMIPLLHNRIPKLGGESYLKSPSIKSHRLKPITPIKRYDPIVFNWPVGDSVYITSTRSWTVDQVNRAVPGIYLNDPELKKKVATKDFVVRPFDKKDHYVKRCIALPGDNLEIRDRDIYIDGVKQNTPSHIQHNYQVALPQGFNIRKLEEWDIDDGDRPDRGRAGQNGWYSLDAEQVELLTQAGAVVELRPNRPDPEQLFPHDPTHFPDWSIDNYGPIWIPAAGETVTLTPENIALYKRVITSYEGHDLQINGNQFTIDGEPADTYTFEQDYYWGMGDNRHNSEDSRAWGFVPADHIVGKPLFIWFSTKEGGIRNGVNWDRIFMSASKACD